MDVKSTLRDCREAVSDPIGIVCAVGAVVSFALLALMPVMVLEFNPPADADVLPCPVAFHDARCTEVMDHAPRSR